MPSTRVWNSGGPPRMSLLAIVAPPAAGVAAVEPAAVVDAAGVDVVGVDVAPLDFFELQALTLSASAAPAAPMIRILRFIGMSPYRIVVPSTPGWARDGGGLVQGWCTGVRVRQIGATSAWTMSAVAGPPAVVVWLVVLGPDVKRP